MTEIHRDDPRLQENFLGLSSEAPAKPQPDVCFLVYSRSQDKFTVSGLSVTGLPPAEETQLLNIVRGKSYSRSELPKLMKTFCDKTGHQTSAIYLEAGSDPREGTFIEPEPIATYDHQ